MRLDRQRLHGAFFRAATSAMMPQLEGNKAPDETFVLMSEQGSS
jgi:hypothetical protein